MSMFGVMFGAALGGNGLIVARKQKLNIKGHNHQNPKPKHLDLFWGVYYQRCQIVLGMFCVSYARMMKCFWR